MAVGCLRDWAASSQNLQRCVSSELFWAGSPVRQRLRARFGKLSVLSAPPYSFQDFVNVIRQRNGTTALLCLGRLRPPSVGRLEMKTYIFAALNIVPMTIQAYQMVAPASSVSVYRNTFSNACRFDLRTLRDENHPFLDKY